VRHGKYMARDVKMLHKVSYLDCCTSDWCFAYCPFSHHPKRRCSARAPAKVQGEAFTEATPQFHAPGDVRARLPRHMPVLLL
jgi:hypothetical protein